MTTESQQHVEALFLSIINEGTLYAGFMGIAQRQKQSPYTAANDLLLRAWQYARTHAHRFETRRSTTLEILTLAARLSEHFRKHLDEIERHHEEVTLKPAPSHRKIFKSMAEVPHGVVSAYRAGAYVFNPPPVSTAYWAELDWINWVHFNCPGIEALRAGK